MYDGCPLTREESDLLIMSHAIRHKINDTELADIIELINVHLPKPSNSSLYLFLKKFSKIPLYKEYYFCPKCDTILLFENDKSKSCTCLKCNTNYTKINLRHDENYFIYVPMKKQLERLLSDKKIFDALNEYKEDSKLVSDVTSGKMYKKLKKKASLRDRISLFNSTPMVSVPSNLPSYLYVLYK